MQMPRNGFDSCNRRNTMQMPRNGCDSLAALARLNTDNTMHHRERWPSLDWVWDALDDLRRWQDEAVDPDDHQKALDERDALSEAAEQRDALSDALSAVTEQRDALSEAVRMLLEPEPDMERVHAILRGVGHD